MVAPWQRFNCKPIICDLQEQCEELRPSVRSWKVTDGLAVAARSSFFYSPLLIVLKIRHESEQFLLLGDQFSTCTGNAEILSLFICLISYKIANFQLSGNGQ